MALEMRMRNDIATKVPSRLGALPIGQHLRKAVLLREGLWIRHLGSNPASSYYRVFWHKSLRKR